MLIRSIEVNTGYMYSINRVRLIYFYDVSPLGSNKALTFVTVNTYIYKS